MKHFLMTAAILSFACFANAQVKAVTETGDNVVLYDDGTWKYAGKEAEEPVADIPTNPNAFQKSPKSTFLLKSNTLKLGVWLDPKKWSFKKSESNEDAEYELQMKGGDVYGMLITERVEIPLMTLRKIAVENGRAVAPDLQITKEEYRTVNGMRVLLLQMDGSMQGIKFSYYGYYYSSPEGTVQFITYTAQALLKESLPDCEQLLNGFVKLD